MKVSNFRNYERTGTSCTSFEYDAEVDFTTGFLWWKKTVTRKIHRVYAEFWFWVDTGRFCQMNYVENLERAYKAQNKIKED